MTGKAETLAAFVEQIREVAGSRFAAAYRFGSDLARGKGKGQARVLLVVDRIDRVLLDKVAPVISAAQQEGIRVRLDTTDNLLRGADAFPAFSLELIRHRELLAGEDVLSGLKVEIEDLRLRVEHGLRGIFRELVANYIDGKVEQGSVLGIRRAARRIVFLMEGALLAAGNDLGTSPTSDEIINEIRAVLPAESDEPWKVLRAFLAGDLSMGTAGMRDLYGALLAILHAVIDHVDRMPDR
ncbi:MAG: hypothetical protein JKY37_16710 [Nannocystaceae bacterium]|nr:hypothetical protein [Nannocystaceae bacterium]